MNTSVKVRLLLLILCISLALTAITVKLSYNSYNLLASSSLTLQKNLQEQELFVDRFLKDPASFNSLKNIVHNEKKSLQLIDEFSKKKKVYFSTYKNSKLDFWSSIRIVPDSSSAYQNGASFIREKNGFYEVIKKTDDDFSVLFFIAIQADYSYHNQYLNNDFSSQLLNNDFITIAGAKDKEIFPIKGLNGNKLFSVKLKPESPTSYFASIEVVLWALSITILFVLMYYQCSFIARKGRPKEAVFIAAIFMLVCISANLFFGYLNLSAGNKVFSALKFNSVYTSRFTISDIALSIIFFTWFAIFLYNNRYKISKPVISPVKSYIILVLMSLLLLAIANTISSLFCGLIIDSKIKFDIDNLINLTQYNLIGAVMLCLAYLIFYLIAETCICVCTQLNIKNREKLFVFVGIILLASIWHQFDEHFFTWFYFLWAAVIIWRAYNIFYEDGKMHAVAYIVILSLSSLIATIKLSHIQYQREREDRKSLVMHLVNPSDETAEYVFQQMESDINKDRFLMRFFANPDRNEVYLKNYLRKTYFDDYLSKYDLKINAYDKNQHNITGQDDYGLNIFKNLVLTDALQVKKTKSFYRNTDAFGTQEYFALVPVKVNNVLQGTVLINLKSKPLEETNSFPPLLVDETNKQDSDFKNYSYAFYKDNKLIIQNGKYEYNLINTQFKGKLKSYTELETKDPKFSHLIYQPNEQKTIVVSIEDKILSDMLSIFIFFFVIFLTFSLFVIAIYWLLIRIKAINFNHIIWSLQIEANNLPYKTRIQISMVASVVFTLLIVGVVTFITFKSQDKKQQDDLNHDKIKRIAADYEGQMLDVKTKNQEELELKFNAFAENFSVDLMLYDTCGVPLLYTQPKLYDFDLISRRMNARAYINLKRLQKSEFTNDENIGSFDFKSAYIPIRNTQHEVVNFLQLPYFSNEKDYTERIGYFINSMLNVYAFVLVAVGLFAVFIAKKITNPLTLIQQGLTNTMYGRKTESIKWKRNDEIGSLIKEYNKMIASLELSANKLAKSERENAWREMAKQVAHEIKNPLTPLKLGLQLLQKAWKDNDPKFDQKFQRFSHSFIEQIESLSRIATEFSDFAKLPDTKPEVVNIFDVISRATNVFNQSDNLLIDFTPLKDMYLIRADKDQLLRCFNNLLKNAIEAMPENHAGVISITYQLTKQNIIIDLKDNGNGIPENVRDNIFQPNFTTKSSGTGLGLAFIKNAIENTGGKIWFETETGVGTTFHLMFPSALVRTV